MITDGSRLKPLDDAFLQMDVTYLRYQDDLIILCKTKRQLERCKLVAGLQAQCSLNLKQIKVSPQAHLAEARLDH
ncbi:MAG: hypothetical protein NTW08_09110 [Gammaproteobacteria bacterium]|nr:hypothetical protein [Gammaproteobacteria bacterium]